MSWELKKLVMFDLDGTLTKSKSPIEPDMAELLVDLMSKAKVAIISGGAYLQFQTQFLAGLPGSVDNFSNLYLLPTSGTCLYVWKGSWSLVYAEALDPVEKQRIIAALNAGLIESGYQKPEKVYGELIEDRGSQITFSAIGQKAPADIKYTWDPNRTKRESIVAAVAKRIPEYDIRIGGSTSIDVTRRGINKAYGIRKLEQYLNLTADNITFVGDALFYGGNDYPAKATGVDCIQVKGPEETMEIIKQWIGVYPKE